VVQQYAWAAQPQRCCAWVAQQYARAAQPQRLRLGGPAVCSGGPATTMLRLGGPAPREVSTTERLGGRTSRAPQPRPLEERWAALPLRFNADSVPTEVVTGANLPASTQRMQRLWSRRCCAREKAGGGRFDRQAAQGTADIFEPPLRFNFAPAAKMLCRSPQRYRLVHTIGVCSHVCMYVQIRRHQHTRVHAHTGPRRHAMMAVDRATASPPPTPTHHGSTRSLRQVLWLSLCQALLAPRRCL